MRGSVVPLILPKIIFVTLLGTVVAGAHYYYPAYFSDYTLAPFALLGAALSLFLGFRNNACYDRWWEARKQWGQLVVDSRSLSRQVISFIDSKKPAGKELQRRIVNLTIAYNHALKHRLRATEPWEDLAAYIDSEELERLRQLQNPPNAILRMMGAKLGDCRHKNLMTDFLVQNLDDRITSIAGVQAACERIKNTPLPFAYMLLVQRTAYLYCLMLPFFLVTSQELLTPLFCAVVTYTFFGLDALSQELEDPFGGTENDLPLDSLSKSIEIDLLETLGEDFIPEPLTPINGRLE